VFGLHANDGIRKYIQGETDKSNEVVWGKWPGLVTWDELALTVETKYEAATVAATSPAIEKLASLPCPTTLI